MEKVEQLEAGWKERAVDDVNDWREGVQSFYTVARNFDRQDILVAAEVLVIVSDRVMGMIDRCMQGPITTIPHGEAKALCDFIAFSVYYMVGAVQSGTKDDLCNAVLALHDRYVNLINCVTMRFLLNGLQDRVNWKLYPISEDGTDHMKGD